MIVAANKAKVAAARRAPETTSSGWAPFALAAEHGEGLVDLSGAAPAHEREFAAATRRGATDGR